VHSGEVSAMTAKTRNQWVLARRVLRHGAFTGPHDLATQMLAFVEHYNLTARPFRWTYTGKVLAA